MKNKNVKYSLVALSILVVVLALLYIFPDNKPFNVSDNVWKASDNPVFGDIIHISKEDSEFQNDTLFTKNIPVAQIIAIESRFWAGERTMTIKNLKTGEVGIYVEK